MSTVPLNIQEFNTITGLIFAQLYKAFPGAENIDRAGIAKAMVFLVMIGASASCARAAVSPKCWRILSGG
jgi:hypothetical protein